MDIQFNNLSKQWEDIKDDALPQLNALFKKSDYIGGKAVGEFEENFAKYCGTEFAVGVSNGTDALKLSLAALSLNPKCGVVIPANTFIATALAPTYLRDFDFELVLVDCDEYYQIDCDVLEKVMEMKRSDWNSSVIIPVHLYGHPANMERVLKIADKYECAILEDSSQAHGAKVFNKRVGSLGDISAFSLYPGKNLGASGDAGIITTNDEELARKVKTLRNYGSNRKYYYDFKGWNNRLDTIQAIIVNQKLKHLDKWNKRRIEVAELYNDLLSGVGDVVVPKSAPYIDNQVYHIYAIRTESRDELQEYLSENDVHTIIHYPIPIQKTKPFKYLDEVYENQNAVAFADELLSLPIHPYLSDEKVRFIADKIKGFFTK